MAGEKEVKLFIDEELWRRLKVVAARANFTAKQVYTTAIEQEVSALEKELHVPTEPKPH